MTRSWCVTSLWAALALGGGCAPESGLDSTSEPDDESPASARQALDDAPAWAASGAMSVARQGATATRLSDGRVLIVGGERVGAVDTGNVFLATAELFDPVTQTFTEVAGKMTQQRTEHAAVLIAGGKVLVAGGRGGSASASTAEIFNPSTGTWKSTPNLAHDYWGATMVVLGDGRVLLAGGSSDTGQAAEIFDPGPNTWTVIAPMKTARRFHAATLLANGRVLVTGGGDPGSGFKLTASAELFTPGSGLWSPTPGMSVPRTRHGAARLGDGVLITGGVSPSAIEASVERYDAAMKQWSPLPPMQTARAIHSATALDNGAVLVAGGVDATSSVLRSTELYDPVTATWVPIGLLGHARFFHVAANLDGGAVLVAGGEHQSSTEVYVPVEDGRTCEVGPQCASGHCVDGVCCNDVCSGQCATCALPGAEGKCSLAAPGTDPHNDCGQGGPCDDVCTASGTCTDRVGEECIASTCVDDGTRAIVAATCSAACAECARETVDCAPYRCGKSGSPATEGCLAQCDSIADCADGFACDTDGQCRLRPDIAAVDPEACSAAAAGPGAPGSSHHAAAWLAGLALAAAVRRGRGRTS